MFSKSLKSILLLALLVGSVSCTPKVGEEPPQTQGPELLGTECLSDAMIVAQDFFKGESKERELDGAFTCAASAFDKFRKYVRGSSPDGYTPQELSDFLRMNFLKKNSDGTYQDVPRGLQTELMKFKQMFVGGSREFITLSEINQSISVIKKFKTIALALNPHMKILMLNWDVANRSASNEDLKTFELANEALQKAASDLTAMILANRPTYVISDFSNLMKEFAKFYKENWAVNEKIERFLPVVKKVKRAIAGGDEAQIVDQEWNSFLLLTVRGYVQFLRYYYFIESQDKIGSAVRLGYVARSIEDIFSIFKDLVAIKPGGVVTSYEVKDIMKAFSLAWPDFKYSDELVAEFMKIKRLFFGGTDKQWEVDDFDRARLKVGKLKEITERFLPYLQIYTLEWNSRSYSYDQALDYFRDAERDLIIAVTELGNLIEAEYSFADLIKFLAEVDRLYPGKSKSDTFVGAVEKYTPLIVELKKIIFTEDDQSKEIVKANQWSMFLTFGSRFYLRYAFSHYFLNDQIERSEKLNSLKFFTDDVTAIVSDLILFKPTKQIAQAEVINVLLMARNLGLISDKIKKASIESATKAALGNILTSPEDRIAGRPEQNFTLKSLTILYTEVNMWLQMENFLFQLFHDRKLTQEDLINAIKEKNKESNTPELKVAFYETALILDSKITLVNDHLGRMIISPKASLYDFPSVSRLNLVRAFSRILMRSFASDLNRINNYIGVNLDEVKTGYSQLKDVFVDLELLDPASDGFSEARFREANLFTPKANGDALASFKEISDILSMITSGLSVDQLFKEDLKRVCLPGVSNINDFKLTVDKECLMSVYSKMYQHLDSLPEYGRYLRSIKMDEWKSYFNNVLKATGHISSMGNKVKMTYVSLVPHVMQYIEMTMTRFDVNNDTVIDTREAINAFPAFKNLLKELAKDDLRKGNITESDLLPIFTYILKFGTPPEGIWNQIYWKVYWKNNQNKWNIRASRTKLSYILGYISEKVGKKAPQNVATDLALSN